MEIKTIELRGDRQSWKKSVGDLIEGFKKKIETDKCRKRNIPLKFLFREQNPDYASNQVILINFEQTVESDFVISEIRNHAFRPLDMERFLMIAKQNSELLNSGPIVDFVSVWEREGELVVPCLWKDSGLIPDLWLVSELWGPECQFAVVS